MSRPPAVPQEPARAHGERDTEHARWESRLAEFVGGEPMDDALSAHLAGCVSCEALAAALAALGREIHEGEPDAARWERLDASLRARLAAEAPPPTPLRRRRLGLVIGLPLAAGLGALALALWALPAPDFADALGSASDETPRASLSDRAPSPEAVLAGATEASVAQGLEALGWEAWDDDGNQAEAAGDAAALSSSSPASWPVPAWGDVMGELEEEIAPLGPAEQAELARLLRGES